ncbi:MAG: hypothetical protein KGI08_05255, partial [Thaumarchaeota archaeon]|nr:hypothetical protein [Nitrososphaerota archaeon]
MATFPTKLIEVFASQAAQIYYQEAVTEDITNQQYEGEIRDKSSILNILTFSKIATHDYTGADMTSDDLTESSGQLKTDQAKFVYFLVKSYDKFRSYIKDPEGTIQAQVAREVKKVIDTYVLGLYTKVQAGNRVGVNVTAGTVAVTVTTGAVAGTNTNFTSAMVGRGFYAGGVWSRVKSVSSTTAMVVEDDLDDVASQYTGGAVSGGAAYIVEAVTPVQVTKSNLYDYIDTLSTMLNDYEIPETDRWLAVSPKIFSVLRQMPEYIPSGVPEAYQGVVQNGKVGQLLGFTVYMSARVNGDNVNGYHCLAGHKSAITFALAFTENG